ncbi:unnamed protein product [Albugo candida]|uniref:Protein kinase domain-containing protein n=1 Tax=Albugo candida TaxID=65357 RepID=A0A024GPB4_9STRA|nr:unnamed protein product [Albugo candida]|eukprot:CCI48367.1 unnamed protein product [Albugo candida]
MVELTLTCLIVGHGATFSCKIDGDELTLYLAKKNGEFLRLDDAVRPQLSKEDCPQEIKDSYMNAKSFMNSPLQLYRFFDQNIQVEKIHVLVQLPANVLRSQKVGENITALYAEKLRDVDMSALDTFRKVEAFISSPLPMKYSTSDDTLINVRPEFFEHSEDRFIKPDVFRDALSHSFTFSDAESANIFWWDMLIRNPIKETATLLGMSIKVGRDQNNKSTTRHLKRPDFLLWLTEVLLMKGEEKGSQREFVTAKIELISKMKHALVPHLLKRLNEDPYDFESVMAIYDAIGRNPIQCTVRCDYDRYARTFELQPVGFTKLPVNDLELIFALICVARALVGLHALGYVHRDIRWPNILCLGGDSYMLIDFENAGRNGDRMPDELLGSRVLDPLVKSDDYGHVYRSCHDMYQFGRLIAETSDPSLAQLRIVISLEKDLQRKER